MTLSFREFRQYSDRKVFASLAAIMVVALGTTSAVIICLHSVLQLRQASIQITKVQTGLDDFYIQLLNAETGQRGYLLTGDSQYLAPYQEALKQIPGKGRQLEAQSAQYSYAPQMKQVQAVAADKLAELSATVAARQNQGPDAALAVVSTGRGQRDMDQLRGLLKSISVKQAMQLAVKRTLATNYGVLCYWISGVMLGVILVLAALVYYLFVQAIKAERALDRAKDEFVSLASHQLRTPATGVKAILSVLTAEDFGPLNARQHHLVGRAVESNERELRVVDELLNVARADAGRLVLKPVQLDFRNVIEAVVTEQRRIIEGKRQQLTVHQPDHPVRLVGDEEKLHMAISNLIDNASKYTTERGNIGVRVRDLRGKVSVEVTDTGMGIEKTELENIFDRFQRARGILTTGVEGTGLGLYLVRRVAQLHNGTIEVDSKEGHGSTFTLTLPCGE